MRQLKKLRGEVPAGYGILAPRDCTRGYHGRRAGLVPQRWLVQAMRSLRVRMAPAKEMNASITRVWRSVQIRSLFKARLCQELVSLHHPPLPGLKWGQPIVLHCYSSPRVHMN